MLCEACRYKQRGNQTVRSVSFAKVPRGGTSERDRLGSSSAGKRAMNILGELHAAEQELIGKVVVLTDAKAGPIDYVYLDDVHGLRISIRGHDGRWPISTLKFIQT